MYTASQASLGVVLDSKTILHYISYILYKLNYIILYKLKIKQLKSQSTLLAVSGFGVSVHEIGLAFFNSPILGEGSEGKYPILWDDNFLREIVCNQVLNSFQN